MKSSAENKKPMLTFHSNPVVKKKYLARVRAHAEADEITNGRYWEDGKGCAVGCTLHSSNHAANETELGIPRMLAKLEDRLFERLFVIDAKAAKRWPEQFLMAPRVGADLSLVWPRFALWMLLDPTDGVRRFTKDGSKAQKSVDEVGALYAAWVAGTKPPAEKFRSAYANAAAAAAASAAAYAAANVAAAAYAAANVAAAAAAYAAANVAAAAAADAARKNLCRKQCKKLLELMATAPVPFPKSKL